MEQVTEVPQPETQIKTLESEVKEFAESLPYWIGLLCEKLLSGTSISDTDIESSYSYFLEDAGLKEVSPRPDLLLDCSNEVSTSYKSNLLLKKLHKVEGVNALAEEQVMEFSPNVTIIYGINGSGKSSYIRLLKKSFINKAVDEPLLNNIHLEEGHKETRAEFVFQSEDLNYTLNYPDDCKEAEFHQFSVFDSKCAPVHLNQKNSFEFRPAGLSIFSELTDAVKRVEAKVMFEIAKKNIPVDHAALFDGDSEIKNLLVNISSKTKIDAFKEFIPFQDTDRENKQRLEEQKAKLLLLKIDKEKSILQEKQSQIEALKKDVINNNRFFTTEQITKLNDAILDCINKESIASKEGIENFKSENLINIGTPEWKHFIEAAEKFANQQLKEVQSYPTEGDHCLLCHQPLSNEAQNLINSYWKFIKSQAELDAKKALDYLNNGKASFEKINFNLLPDDSLLTQWLKENYPETVQTLIESIHSQSLLSKKLIKDLAEKAINTREQYLIDSSCLDDIITDIISKLDELNKKDPSAEIEKIEKQLNHLSHKEKLATHIEGIEDYIKTLKWIETATKAKSRIPKKRITDTEKELSAKYFNQAYIDSFNKIAAELNGNFGVQINYTGSSGSSYRQLLLKGKTPSQILSEGEQKVVSLADYLAEIHVSGINKGVIFDDPVTSLDEERKSIIAELLVKESQNRQVIIFTHDLVFVSSLISAGEELKVEVDCHWIEKLENTPGTIWLKNTPSYEKLYKKSGKAQEYYQKARKCEPELREYNIKNGFAALRTSYETLVVFDLFNGVVQRFNERISVDSLSNVVFDAGLRDEILDSFYQACRYMEGHSHSDKYAYMKPTLEHLNEEIQRFDTIKQKLAKLKKLGITPS